MRALTELNLLLLNVSVCTKEDVETMNEVGNALKKALANSAQSLLRMCVK